MASEASINDWIVALSGDDLRQELANRGLSTVGTKGDLQRRLANEVYVERGVDQQPPTPGATGNTITPQTPSEPPPPYELPTCSSGTAQSVQSGPLTSRPSVETPRTSSPIDSNQGLSAFPQGGTLLNTGTRPRDPRRQSGGLAAAVNALADAHRNMPEFTESGYHSQNATGYYSQSTTGCLGQSERQNNTALPQQDTTDHLSNAGPRRPSERISFGNMQRQAPYNSNLTGSVHRSFAASTAILNSQPDNRLLISDISNHNAGGNVTRLNNEYSSTNPRRVVGPIINLMPPIEGQFINNNNENYGTQNNAPRPTGYLRANNTQRQQNFPAGNRESSSRSVHFNDAYPNNSERRVIIPTPMSAFEFLRKWNLTFTGRRDEDSEEFLTRIKEARFIMNITDDELFSILPFFFRGVALHWFRSNLNSWFNFDQFEEAWRARFSDSDFQYALLENARRRTQGERELVVDYLTFIKAMFDRMVPPLGAAREIDLALRNMLPRLQVRIDKAEIFTFQELEAVAVRKEKSLIIAKTYRPPPGAEESLLPDLAYRDQCAVRPIRQTLANLSLEENDSQQLGDTSASDYAEELPPELEDLNAVDYQGDRRFNNTPRTGGYARAPNANTHPPAGGRNSNRTQTLCFNCGKPGHFSRECTNPRRIICYKCGKTGVKFTNCPTCHPPEVFCVDCGLVGYTKANCPECAGNAS